MKTILLILNPCAGVKTGMKNLADILKIFSDAGYMTTVLMTGARGDATNFAQNLGNQYDLVVCVGGDGTFNEVVAGLHGGKIQCPLGYIPAGSTNDFARSLGLASDPIQAAKDIVDERSRVLPFDVGEFNGRVFTYVASFGAFTKVSYTTPQNTKNILGHLAYVLEGIKDIPSITKEHMSIVADSTTYTGDYIFGAISNSTSIGGILKLDRNRVDMSDGVFELLLIRAPATAVDLVQILHCLSTKKFNTEWVTLASAQKIHIKAEKSMDWTLDGEQAAGKRKLNIVNCHHAIQLVVPTAALPAGE